MKKLTVAAFLFLLSACTTRPPSTIGLYGSEPVAQKIPGSNAQAIVTRTVEFARGETFEAAKQAMLRLGYNVEEKNEKRGMLTANGDYHCSGAARTPVTMAVHIQQINNKPETKFTIIMDRHNFECFGGGELRGANQLAQEIQKILSTY